MPQDLELYTAIRHLFVTVRVMVLVFEVRSELEFSVGPTEGVLALELRLPFCAIRRRAPLTSPMPPPQ